MTDDQLINLAKVEAGWEALHQLCLDATIAERLAKVLEQHPPDMAYEAAVWAGVLRDMHPGLKVHLPFVNRAPSSPENHVHHL